MTSPYERESAEFVFLQDLQLEGVPVTDFDNVTVSVVDAGARPTAWEDLLTVNASPAFKIGPGTSHDYSGRARYPVYIDVYAKVDEADEDPVIPLGSFMVT